MPFDAHKNLAVATIVTAPSPPTTGTTITVGAGSGARFPVAPFNVTLWSPDLPPDPTTAEVARCTAIAGDTLTLTRAQEGTTAQAVAVGYLVAETITAKALTDIESGVNFPGITTTGTISGGHFGSAGNIYFSGPGQHTITLSTPDGADNGAIAVAGGGAGAAARGAYIAVWGNESGTPGILQLVAGDLPGGSIDFYTGPTTFRGRLHASGGWSWGGPTDPGNGALLIGISNSINSAFIQLNPYANGLIQINVTTTAAANQVIFGNPGGIAGYIQTVGASTTYGTTSDARLKTDRGLLTDPEVLRHTKIHHFTWNTDGTVGRGVFAQEAITVAPFAVSVGTDERDESGNLKQPWGVDYSKFVPDLIVGWQYHDALVSELRGRIAVLEAVPTPKAAYYGTTDPPPVNRGSAWFSRVRDLITAWWARPSWV